MFIHESSEATVRAEKAYSGVAWYRNWVDFDERVFELELISVL